MQRSCSIALTGCPGVDSPITNISAEAPDPMLFWGQIWNPYNPYRPIPLGTGEYVKVDCDDLLHQLFSIYDPIVFAGTQLDANIRALATELGCLFPNPSPGQIYENDAQTATVYCADGSAFSYTVPAGTQVSPELDAVLGAAWLDWANAWAQLYALEQASALQACVVNEPTDGDLPTGTPGDNPPIPTTPPSGGLIPNVVWLCKDDELYRTYSVSGSDLTQFTFSIVDGSIPTGTLFDQTGPRKAAVSGFPSVPGEYQFKIRAVSVTSPLITSEVWAAIFVFGIANPDLPNGQPATAYSQMLVAAGGTAPYTFALSSGSGPLPDGLTLASDGTISGTPTVLDTFDFTVTITDSNGGTCDQDLSITIGNCPDPDTWAWDAPFFSTSGNGYGSHSEGNITFDVTCGVLTSSAGNGAVYSSHGSCAYSGAGCNVNLHFEVATVGDRNKTSWGVSVLTRVSAGIYTTLYHADRSTTADGVYDIPLTLPDYGGASEVRIEVTNQVPSLGFTGLPAQVDLKGSLTNV